MLELAASLAIFVFDVLLVFHSAPALLVWMCVYTLCAVTLPVLTIGFEGLSVDRRTKHFTRFQDLFSYNMPISVLLSPHVSGSV